jgi:two-component system sensor histidine kinase KdpD
MLPAWIHRLLRTLVSAAIVALVTVVAYGFHAKSFAAGFIYLLPVMCIAFEWGFLEASVASVLSVGCLDYFFTDPLFHFYMSDPQDWIALFCFETIVLVVSRFAVRLKRHASEADRRREQVEKLYLVSRDILMLDYRYATGVQIAHLLKQIFQLDSVSLWDAREARIDAVGTGCISEDEVRATYFHGRRNDDAAHGSFLRLLLVGTRAIGSIGLKDASFGGFLDGYTSDAIASLAALALERSYSFKVESGAEASRQSEQLRSAVLDGLAHAFKTPLTTIQAASSGLLEIASLPPEHGTLVSLINEEVIHLGQLTTKALQTARIDQEELKANKEEVQIETFLAALAEQASPHLLGHQLLIKSEASSRFLLADAGLLKMALLELIDNAAKYSDPASPITVRASMLEAEIVFGILNEGSYIAPEERLRIFRRFYRSPGSQYRASGTGIGLSFVKRIAEAHAGRVWVDSDAKTGTTFFLTLPDNAYKGI